MAALPYSGGRGIVTDQRLRDLERDAGKGDLEARARLLQERVRVGDLTEERLRLAAYLGDEVACLALGHALRLLVAMDAEWFRGLIPWSPALAVWALAEACSVERRPECEQLLDEFRVGLRAALIAGTGAEFARSQAAADLGPLSYDSPAGKSLVLWTLRLRDDGRRSRPDDPDVLRAIEDVRSRFRSLEASELAYAWSERTHDGAWVHKLRHVRRSDARRARMATVVACAGWQPDADATPADPDFLYDLNFALSDPERARAAVRTALLPWALAPRRSSP